jgi:unsaturated chondroitin disaccharide hydrolase
MSTVTQVATREQALDLAIEKIRRNIPGLYEHQTTWGYSVDGDYVKRPEGFFNIWNWTTSFFTGMALIAYKKTGDEHFLKHVLALEPLYQAKVNEYAEETMHDLGFLYSLYSVALYKLTGDKRHRELGLRAADVFAARFIPEGDYIRAWGRMDETDSNHAGMAIIDCMMNLQLLYWATEETGDPKYRDIAIRHSLTTIKTFIREDDSIYHCFRFDLKTGAPERGDNDCGYAVESHWARGTAWAIYGFAMGYRYTGDERFLDASLRLARKFISELDEEVVPMWDFRLHEGVLQIRDSSAAAIVACGFQELESLGKADALIRETKTRLLDRLCSEDYLDTDLEVRGLLKHGQVGNAFDSYTSWGDYYFTEALARETGMEINWW